MGLFSRKTKVYVSSRAYQLGVSDPDALATNTLIAIKSGTSMSAMVKNMVVSGMANKVRIARRYAKSTYTLGLPSGNFNTLKTVSDNILATIIAADISYPLGVVVGAVSVVPLTPFHFAQEFILANRDWDMKTNMCGVLPPAELPDGPLLDDDPSIPKPTTHTCELTDAITSDDSSDVTLIYTVRSFQQALSYEIVGTIDSESMTHNLYGWVWLVTQFNSQVVTEVITVPSTHILGVDHYIITYQKLTEEGFEDTKYMWYYSVEDPTYPELAEYTDEIAEFSGLPVVPLRYNNKDLTDEAHQETELYLTSKKLLRKLNITIEDVAAELNANDSVNDIDHAYVMFGIDIQTEEQNSLRYLVHFFDELSDRSTVTQLGINHAYLAGESYDLRNSYSISSQYTPTEVTLEEYGLDIKISYNWVRSELRIGNIGVDGEIAKKGFVAKEYIRQTGFDDYVEVEHGQQKAPVEWDKSKLILKMQLTPTTYRHIEVEGLQQTNLVYASKSKSINTTLSNVIDDEDEHNLIIPVDYNIALKLDTFSRNIVYEESLQLIMNSVVFVKEDWYQTAGFKLVSHIIVAVLTYFSIGVAFTALSAITTVDAFILFTIVSIGFGVVTNTAFTWLASKIGADWTAIIGVIVLAVTLYFGAGMGKFTVMGKSVGTAEMCLKMSMSMIESANVEVQNQIEQIGQEYDEFIVESEEQMKILQAAQELLMVEPTGELLLNAQTTRYELHPLSSDPGLFYELTVHTGNVGALVYDMIPLYHTVMTTLPDPDKLSFT